MSQLPAIDNLTQQLPAVDVATGSEDRWMAELGTLLQELEHVNAAGAADSSSGQAAENQLVRLRLGIASGLFAALQCKYAASAGHSLRVALTCSAWAGQMRMEPAQRDYLEIAALLHDIGVIGVPDHVLLKPGLLDSEEAAIFARSRAMSKEILRRSCTVPEILKIVENVAAWYDGSRGGCTCRGEQIPLASRMIAIVEAFDSMTTDRVYRSAMSQERAMAELFRCAGTQFDPLLVRRFVEFRAANGHSMHKEVAGRWLKTLDPDLVNSYWEHNCVPSPGALPAIDASFHGKLLDNMYDAVLFVDTAGCIKLWNRGAERLTGIAGPSICHRKWQPELLQMSDEKGRLIHESDCPVRSATDSGVQSLRRLTICGRNGRAVAVDVHAIPVIAADGAIQGSILLLHDASSESTLEQRCQSLHEKATRDPLTQVANRAEFDRVHTMFIEAHQQQQVPCSLIMCDLDHFKLVNDTFGHQAGDVAIKSLATLLKGACHAGDLVARYGGEEFVMLCADCDNAAAARRAEQVRKGLAQMPQPQLDGRPITASFGVTQVQAGDTIETMLRRSDRALLMAKERGRNTVVQLGTGANVLPSEPRRRFWPFGNVGATELLTKTLVSTVPMQVAIEKLRGFVADHQATILKIEGDQVQLEISDGPSSRLRRFADRPINFLLDIHIEEQRLKRERTDASNSGIVRTRIQVVISPRRTRNRRGNEVSERAQQVLASLRSYLMASEEDDDGAPAIVEGQ